MFQSPSKAGRASLRRSLLLMFAISHTRRSNFGHYKVHKLFICFTNNGVYSLHIDTCVFLRLLPRVLSLLIEWTLVLFGKS